jgi:hypothetical protein
MSMPGFTAEFSAYRTNYQHRAAVRNRLASQSLTPQWLRGASCFATCIADSGDDPFAYHNCRCICYGRPGKTCWPM